MIDCARLLHELDDFVDQALPPGERLACEEHLRSCDACRAEAVALQALVDAARSLPREMQPEQNLWERIAARIRPGVTSTSGLRLPAWRWLPVAAALLIAATALLSIGRFRGLQAPPARPAEGTWPDTELQRAEAEYERAARNLSAALEAERQRLPEGAAGTVERNVRVIDQALGELRLAMAKDPGNPLLARLLLDTYRQKVDVLSRAHRLSTSL